MIMLQYILYIINNYMNKPFFTVIKCHNYMMSCLKVYCKGFCCFSLKMMLVWYYGNISLRNSSSLIGSFRSHTHLYKITSTFLTNISCVCVCLFKYYTHSRKGFYIEPSGVIYMKQSIKPFLVVSRTFYL